MKADGHTFSGRMNKTLPNPELSESFIHKTHMPERWEGQGCKGGLRGLEVAAWDRLTKAPKTSRPVANPPGPQLLCLTVN